MIFFLAWATALFPVAAPAQEGRNPAVAVLISKNIRPYVEAAEGLSSTVREGSAARIQTFFLEGHTGKGRTDLAQQLGREGFEVLAAVGPDAATLIWKELPEVKAGRLYCMVLNPEDVVPAAAGACGISLNIPVERQLRIIAQGLPDAARLGILYDPAHNAQFLREILDVSGSGPPAVVPLGVTSRKEIPALLTRSWEAVDALWLIPDRTVVSESVVQYIIKEGLIRGVPVIGYNRFFYESGAALALVFDYGELGAQAGGLILRLLRGEPCSPEPPKFHVWVNRRAFSKLRMESPDVRIRPFEAGP